MQRIIKAFIASLAAIRFGWQHETALRQEIILLVVAIPIAPLLTLNPWKLIALWGSLLILIAIEFLNTGIEKLADRITTEHDELIGIAKDCGSAAVLMASLLAGGIWLLVIWERMFS